MHLAPSAIFLATLVAGTVAHAHELSETDDGVPLRWAGDEIGFEVQFDPSVPDERKLASASRRAFDTWAFAAKGALRPRYEGPGGPSDPADDRCTISSDAVWDPAFGEPERAVAFAWVAFDPETGIVREGDVHLNAEHFRFADGASGSFDIESVVLHELGHVLGLAHSCGLPGRTYPSCFSVPDEPAGHRVAIVDAVMAPTLAPGTHRRGLGADDRAGLAVNFGGPQDERPRISQVDRRCPEGDWAVTLAAAWPGAQVFSRGEDGTYTEWPVRTDGATLRVEAPMGDAPFDLLVVDPVSGVYDARVDVSAPPPCVSARPDAGVVPTEAPAPSAQGCSCAAKPPTESGRGGFALVMLVSSMFALLSRRALAVALLLGGAFVASPAAAFECSRTGTTVGPSLVWGEREVPWYAGRGVFDLLGDEATGRADVLASFHAWEEPACSDLLFPFLGEATVSAGFDDTGDNENVVVRVDQLWPYQTGAIAVTTTAYDTRNGVVVDADIEINASNFRFSHIEDSSACTGVDNLMDLQNTLTHEVGHIVGLEHPPNTARYAEATMFASAPACETKKRTLAEDDIDGLCFIYPAGAATQQCYPPDGPSFVVVDTDDGFGGCHSAPGGLVSGWVLLGILGALRRRRAA